VLNAQCCLPERKIVICNVSEVAFSALVGQQEGHPACKKRGMVRVGTGYPDGVAPGRMVGVSASVSLAS